MFLEVFTTTGALSGSVLALLFLDQWPCLVFAALLGYMAYAAYSKRNLDDARIRTGEFALAKPAGSPDIWICEAAISTKPQTDRWTMSSAVLRSG